MNKPLLTRSLPKRLQLLSKPMVWVPSIVFVFLCLGLWQYYAQQSSKSGRGLGQIEPAAVSDSPKTNSPALSEIDTLELLLESSRGVANPAATDGKTASELPSDLALTTPTGQSTGEPFNQPSDQTDPFAAYRSEYQFQSGSKDAIADPSVQPATSASGRVNFGAGLVNPTAPNANSALSEALKRQQATQAQSDSQTEDPGAATPNRPNTQSNPNSINTRGSRTTAPYTSATPNMSPPVGTTGYQLPNTVPLPNSTLPTIQPSRNLSPTSAPAPLSPAARVNTPNVLYTPPTFTQPDQGQPISPRQ